MVEFKKDVSYTKLSSIANFTVLVYYSKICIYSFICLYILYCAVLCCAKMLQSCLNLCDPMDHSPLGDRSTPRILERLATPSCRGSSRLRDRAHVPYLPCTGRWVLSPSGSGEKIHLQFRRLRR